MRDALLNLVKVYTASQSGQMTLSRLGPTTYPDPAKTSYDDSVSWTVELMFGRGYFDGAAVRMSSRWAVPHDSKLEYVTVYKDLPLEAAVDLFLSDEIPEN